MKFQSDNMRPNKLLGQHFLHSRTIISAIIRAAKVTRSDTVLEVGPGKGILTEALIHQARRVIAVEKDKRLCEFLRKKFSDAENLSIVEGDAIKTKLALPKKFKIVANIPYYLTSRFIRKFLAAQTQSMTLLIQYEVARRVCAAPPSMNLLALSVQAYADPKIMRKVPRRYFHPEPKVDSALITITKKKKSFFEKKKIDERVFFSLTKKAFSQKRKTLKNSLGINSHKRPQELTLSDWASVIHTHTRTAPRAYSQLNAEMFHR